MTSCVYVCIYVYMYILRMFVCLHVWKKFVLLGPTYLCKSCMCTVQLAVSYVHFFHFSIAYIFANKDRESIIFFIYI
jgi:hypothetical protein